MELGEEGVESFKATEVVENDSVSGALSPPRCRGRSFTPWTWKQIQALVSQKTWLDSTCNITEYFPSHLNMQVFYRNRPEDSHGGVLIAVSNEFICTQEPDLETDCEMVCIAGFWNYSVTTICPKLLTSLPEPDEERDRYYRKTKGVNTTERKEKLNQFKKEINKKMKECYWKYIEEVVLDINTDTTDSNQSKSPSCKQVNKKFWSFLKSLKSERAGVSHLKNEGRLISDGKAKANILNQQFQSVFTNEPLEAPLPNMGPSPHPLMPEINIVTNGITTLLENLNPHKACGPDHVHACVLKELSSTLSPFLQVIFQKSLDTGAVPEAWKEANIAPIYKKGNRLDPANYRPISLTCICSKIMEHIIASSMMSHFDTNNILYDLQHGFRHGRSCETQLLSLIDDLAHNRENGTQTDLIIMDFAKAFDKVPHLRLIHKLQFYGITGKALVWIQNFLQGRSQTVVLDGERSDPVPVTSGVPQGTVLGPILFLAYINDLPKYAAHAKVRLFADDCILQMSIKEEDDCKRLQHDIDSICSWEKEWLMAFNPSKCEVMTVPSSRNPITFPYSLHDHVLTKVSTTKYLGVSISSNLTWGRHVDLVTAKANRTLGMLRRCLRISSNAAKERAYMALVRPSLEYGCSVWDPHTKDQVSRVEMVQRRAARFVCSDYRRTSSVSSMLQNLGWQSLEVRRKIARQPSRGSDLPPAFGRRAIRRAVGLAIASRTNFYRLSFFPRTIREWNELEPGAAEAGSLAQFKSELARTLLH
ncbi:hypothetical protein Bbelb_111590 [Branchiostoma belcheri]|nr:hypothetical protein Bbelb_111590 [Branchiostoma belcheri]